jgi:glucuronoarabinoxylan endo-1,4-beta-xylanase
MAGEGVPLAAISAQNEPNYTASWDTCRYTPDQMVTFVRDNLGPALAALTPPVPVMAPETQGWDQFARYAGPLMADPGAVALMGPLATHHYAGAPSVFAPAAAAGKVVWETEVSDGTTYNANEAPINDALRVAKMIHADLADGNVSAWHYWWLMPSGTTSGFSSLALPQDSTTLGLRAWALGNWSRFVRPGFVRVAATESPQQFVSVTSFTDPASGQFVIVALNEVGYDLDQQFTITGGTTDALTPWVTSATQTLAAQAPVPVVDGAFSVTLPAQSVTSFVGTVTLAP